jgi:hypothetical protein
MQHLEVSSAVQHTHIYIYIYIYMTLGGKGLKTLLVEKRTNPHDPDPRPTYRAFHNVLHDYKYL